MWSGTVLHPYNTGRHIGEESSISNFRMGLAVGATIRLYKYTFGPRYGQDAVKKAIGFTPGSENDPSIKAIRSQYALPGQDPAAEGEAVYEYRLGLREGLNFDFHNQNGRRGRRKKEPK
jgi:hypothetical protein